MASYSGGAKIEGGQTIPHDIYLISWASNGVTKYTTFRYRDGDASCDCPGWTRHKSEWSGGRRQCKHTKKILTMAESRDETGTFTPPPATVAAPPAAAPVRRALDYLPDEEDP